MPSPRLHASLVGAGAPRAEAVQQALLEAQEALIDGCILRKLREGIQDGLHELLLQSRSGTTGQAVAGSGQGLGSSAGGVTTPDDPHTGAGFASAFSWRPLRATPSEVAFILEAARPTSAQAQPMLVTLRYGPSRQEAARGRSGSARDRIWEYVSELARVRLRELYIDQAKHCSMTGPAPAKGKAPASLALQVELLQSFAMWADSQFEVVQGYLRRQQAAEHVPGSSGDAHI